MDEHTIGKRDGGSAGVVVDGFAFAFAFAFKARGVDADGLFSTSRSQQYEQDKGHVLTAEGVALILTTSRPPSTAPLDLVSSRSGLRCRAQFGQDFKVRGQPRPLSPSTRPPCSGSEAAKAVPMIFVFHWRAT